MVGLIELTDRVMERNAELGKQPYHPLHCGPCWYCSQTMAQNGIEVSGATEQGADNYGMHRYHVLTDNGRKTVWAPDRIGAICKVGDEHFLAIHSAPNPLECATCGRR